MTEKKKRNGKSVVAKKKGGRGKRKKTSPIRASPKKPRFVIPADSIPEKMLADILSLYKDKQGEWEKMDKKKVVLLNLPYLLFAYFFNKIIFLYRVSAGVDATEKLLATLNYFDQAFSNPLPSFHYMDLLYGAAGGIAVKLIVYYKAKNAKKYRHGVEYGSARWGTPKDLKP